MLFPRLAALATTWSLCATVLAQDPDCARYHEGRFSIADEDGGSPTIITRKGSRQREEADGTVLSFKVTWLDECTYTLRIRKVLRNPKKHTFDPDLVLKVEIIGTDSDSYVQRSTAEGYDLVYISTVRVTK